MDNARTQDLSELVTKTLKYEEMITSSEWESPVIFEKDRDDLDKVFTIVSYLDTLPITYLTDNAIQEITAAVRNINDDLEQIDALSVETGGPDTARTTLVTRLHTETDALYEATAQWIPFLACQSGDI